LGEHDAAFQDFESILNNESASDDIKINALIKRAALYMQLDNPEMTFKDFELAISINPNYSDIYHHRGQVRFEHIFLLHTQNNYIIIQLYNNTITTLCQFR